MSNAENQAVNQTHRAQSGIKQVGLNFKRALDHSTADEPAATLALAAVFGFVLGALWKA